VTHATSGLAWVPMPLAAGACPVTPLIETTGICTTLMITVLVLWQPSVFVAVKARVVLKGATGPGIQLKTEVTVNGAPLAAGLPVSGSAGVRVALKGTPNPLRVTSSPLFVSVALTVKLTFWPAHTL
jgi:hypothetical protein